MEEFKAKKPWRFGALALAEGAKLNHEPAPAGHAPRREKLVFHRPQRLFLASSFSSITNKSA